MKNFAAIRAEVSGLILTIKTGIKANKVVPLTDNQMEKRYKELGRQYQALMGGASMNAEDVKTALAEGRITLDDIK